MPVTLYLHSLDLFQNVTIDGWNFEWTQWNKGLGILFLSSYHRTCYNILDASFCALCVVLQWEYKFFTVLSELDKFFINLLITDGDTFWKLLQWWLVGNNWIPAKNLGFMVSESQKFLPIVVLTFNLWTLHHRWDLSGNYPVSPW